jgi:phosphate:Na+ symporter
MPLIGVGVLLRLTGEGQRRGAIGSTLAGFGLLFFGIAMLQQSFTGLAGQVTLPQGEGPLAVLAQVGVGVVMTVLMQSSSASIAIALTAAQGGLLTTQGAAAVVIGANIGTTVTALLAAIGATPNAQRAATAQVLFNAITGLVALALLPWLIGALGTLREALGLPSDPAAKLALFHTIFNVIGVLLMWPLAAPLTRWLKTRFKAHEEDAARPQHLDDNVLQVPALAVDALTREVARLGHTVVHMARAAAVGAAAPALARDLATTTQLNAAIETFAERMNRSAMAQRTSERLAQTLRVLRYHQSAAEQVGVAVRLRPVAAFSPTLTVLDAAFAQHADALLTLCDPQAPEPETAALDAVSRHMETAYEDLKSGLLNAGAAGVARLADMEEALRRYSALRRAAQQAAKARRRWPAETQAETDASLA